MSFYKIISSGKEARQKLAKGADALAKATISTLGPLSRNVAINRYPFPEIYHDGFTIADEIRLKDPFEDMGAALLKQATMKTNELVGDGTTTATLLANTLVQEGLVLTEGGLVDGVISGKVNPMVLRDKLVKYAELISDMIDERARKITEKKDYFQIAKISAGSEEIGQLVADAIEKVTQEGIIMVEEGASFESGVEYQEGFDFDNGYLSGYFVTDPDRMTIDYEDGYVLLTDYTIADPMMLVPVVEKVMAENNKPLLIVADDVVGPALQALAVTKLKAGAKLVAVVSPGFGDRRKEMLEDMAVLFGGNVITRNLEKKLPDVELKDLGKFRNLHITQTTTTISPKHTDSEEIEERVKVIKEQIAQAEGFQKQRLEERLAKFAQQVAIITIGGGTDAEIKEKKARAIDAVHAVKAALSEGVVPGGGVALKDIAEKLANEEVEPGKKSEKDLIRDLVISTLTAPMRTILANAGINRNDMRSFPEGVGVNVFTGEIVNMVDEGVLDPAKVTKLAVRHSFSIAGNILTTETLVSDDPEEDRNIQKVKAV